MWACIFQNNEHVEDVCHEKDTKEKVPGAVAEVFPTPWQSLIIWTSISLQL
jgi:hypothetical protein